MPDDMATITTFPQHDPETGDALDNLEMMPADVIALLRSRGLSDAEIRTLSLEVHDAVGEARQILQLLTSPTHDEN